MSDTFETLMRRHDGPASRAELAAARWGAGAWRRLLGGADAALVEARLRDCIAALARLRRSRNFTMSDAAARLSRLLACYRRAAVSRPR